MNKLTVGIFAHVDAGKTTFSEQLLFQTQAIHTLGRVDHKSAFLDTHSIEKARGITIFAEQAYFDYADCRYYLIDTPGHVDFSSEMSRTIEVIDYFFVNKLDAPHAGFDQCLERLEGICDVTGEKENAMANGQLKLRWNPGILNKKRQK